MSIKITCNVEGYTDDFIEFVDKGWKFSDRRRFFQANDIELFEVIVAKVESCKIEGLDELSSDIEDWDNVPLELWPWIATAFRYAMWEVMSLPPASLLQQRAAEEKS